VSESGAVEHSPRKSHPFDPGFCGATPQEAAAIFTTAAALTYAATAEVEPWKQVCIDAYVQCIQQKWTGRCYDCLRYCEGQREWPLDPPYGARNVSPKNPPAVISLRAGHPAGDDDEHLV
jgi:hypothetical protein